MSRWIYQIVGGASVLLFAELLRTVLCQQQDTEGAQIGGFLILFKQIRRQIAYHCAPIGEIFSHIEPSVFVACSGRDAPIVADSLTALTEHCIFLNEALEDLAADASRQLGRGYRDEQIAACDRYLASLERLATENAKRVNERNRVLAVLLRAAAIGIVILLW